MLACDKSYMTTRTLQHTLTIMKIITKMMKTLFENSPPFMYNGKM